MSNLFAELTPELGHQTAPEAPCVTIIEARGVRALSATVGRLRAILATNPDTLPDIAQRVRSWISPTELDVFVAGDALTERDVGVLIEATLPGVRLGSDGRFARKLVR